MKTKKDKSAAILTIFDAPNMSAKGRRNVITWLKRQTQFLEHNHAQFSKRFTARYIYS